MPKKGERLSEVYSVNNLKRPPRRPKARPCFILNYEIQIIFERDRAHVRENVVRCNENALAEHGAKLSRHEEKKKIISPADFQQVVPRVRSLARPAKWTAFDSSSKLRKFSIGPDFQPSDISSFYVFTIGSSSGAISARCLVSHKQETQRPHVILSYS
ncbi:hypothetical protein PUN28_013590 [Cardiocondyla obscurior]|uniref:Uncharacterized protein n=1 Tax=Cardiocondyla obscurior TaxID=286306 RepID=A0AAW2F3P3_9HYME